MPSSSSMDVLHRHRAIDGPLPSTQMNDGNDDARASAPPSAVAGPSTLSQRQSHSSPRRSGRGSSLVPRNGALTDTPQEGTSSLGVDAIAAAGSSSAMPLDAAKQVIDAARSALASSDEPLVPREDPSRHGRRAATSPSFADDLLSKARAAAADPSSSHPLSTEILPAPPQLPYDPRYPPLDPDAPPAPLHAPNSMAAAASHPVVLPNGTVVQPHTGSGSASGSGDKKRKQPTFALSKPEGYEGKVPYALYAIVNGLPEADSSKVKGAAAGKRKQGKGAKQSARSSRSSTPTVPRGDDVGASISANTASGISSDAPPLAAANVASSSHSNEAADTSLSLVDDFMLADGEEMSEAASVADSEREAAVDAASSPAMQTDAPLLRINGSSSVASGSSAPSTSPPMPSSSSSPPPHAAMVDGGRPSAPERHSSAAAASHTAQADQSGAMGDARTLATDPTLAIPNTTKKNSKKKAASQQRQTQLQFGQKKSTLPAIPDSSKLAPSAAASSSGSSDDAAKIEAERATSIAATTHASMDSRDTSPASTNASALTPVPEVVGSSAGASDGGGARPTRAAVAKVAARGSYYDPSTYAAASAPPPQAALVHGIGGGGATTANGAPSSRTGSRKGRKSGAAAGATDSTSVPNAKGKGKEEGMAQQQLASGLPDSTGLDDGGNDEFCSTCLGTGHFICCDSCPRSFHFACVNPPLDINEVPLDDDEAWHCQSCSALRHPPPAPTNRPAKQLSAATTFSSSSSQRSTALAAARKGVFSHLIHHAETTNPTLFSLPADVKNFFKGVGSERDGAFLDTSKLRSIKADKKGVIEERDPFRLKDSKGRQVLCFACGKSALPSNRAIKDEIVETTTAGREEAGWRRIISCDYCSLHWHLDCLTPPLAGMPSQFRRWKCPCHIEELLAHTRVPKSSTQVQIIDLPVPTVANVGMRPGQFYRPRVLNSGQIDIVPDPLDTYWSSATAGGSAPGGAGSGSEGNARSLQQGWTNMEIPQADALIPGGGMRKVKFRLPEKVVRTDWWMKVLDGPRDRLIDVDASASSQTGLDFLASIASSHLSEQTATEQLVRVALNSSAPPSIRLQPLAEHVKDPPPQLHAARAGELPNGGVLKKEENDELPASEMRTTVGMVRELDAKPVLALPSKRPKSLSSSGDDSDLTDVDEDAAEDGEAAVVGRGKKSKRTKVDVDQPAVEQDEDDLDSLRAVRELMRKKGKEELLAFLRS